MCVGFVKLPFMWQDWERMVLHGCSLSELLLSLSLAGSSMHQFLLFSHPIDFFLPNFLHGWIIKNDPLCQVEAHRYLHPMEFSVLLKFNCWSVNQEKYLTGNNVERSTQMGKEGKGTDTRQADTISCVLFYWWKQPGNCPALASLSSFPKQFTNEGKQVGQGTARTPGCHWSTDIATVALLSKGLLHRPVLQKRVNRVSLIACNNTNYF